MRGGELARSRALLAEEMATLEQSYATGCARSIIRQMCTPLPDRGAAAYSLDTIYQDEAQAEAIADAARYLEYRGLLLRHGRQVPWCVLLGEPAGPPPAGRLRLATQSPAAAPLPSAAEIGSWLGSRTGGHA